MIDEVLKTYEFSLLYSPNMKIRNSEISKTVYHYQVFYCYSIQVVSK